VGDMDLCRQQAVIAYVLPAHLEFQPSSAICTFCLAVTSVNGGSGGLLALLVWELLLLLLAIDLAPSTPTSSCCCVLIIASLKLYHCTFSSSPDGRAHRAKRETGILVFWHSTSD
jgi:hypothetical protein